MSSTRQRKASIVALSDSQATKRSHWIARSSFYYDDEREYMRFLIPEGLRVIELGCGTGHLLAALKPAFGVGVDISEKMISIARADYPELQFRVADIENKDWLQEFQEPFDAVVLSDTLGSLDDCLGTLSNILALCNDDTQIIIADYSSLWEPALRLAEKLGQKMPQIDQNWLSMNDLISLCELAGYRLIKREWRQLIPKRLFGIGTFLNRYIAHFPLIRRLCLRHYLVVRPIRGKPETTPSTSVVIPCRNEQGNIESAILRMPRFCNDLQIIFVEGNSQDGTWQEILRVRDKYTEFDIEALRQDGKGKGDAVRKGFDHARGDILMILDADLTVPPETLPRFYEAIVSGKGDFAMGSRMVYPVEKMAMRFLNYWANSAFAAIFSWLLNQRITDTLCGTKVLRRDDYKKLAANRAYFGDFDPFGDFDLIFGAAKLNLKIQEIPIRYRSREYGETQISRFQNGWMLLKMVVFAFTKLKSL